MEKNERLQEILSVHKRNKLAKKQTLEDDILLGQLLSEQKAELAHGEWKSWLAENVPFISPATDRNYRKLYRNRAKLKTLNVSSLSEAYRALRRKPKPMPEPPKKSTWGRIPKDAPKEPADDLPEPPSKPTDPDEHTNLMSWLMESVPGISDPEQATIQALRVFYYQQRRIKENGENESLASRLFRRLGEESIQEVFGRTSLQVIDPGIVEFDEA